MEDLISPFSTRCAGVGAARPVFVASFQANPVETVDHRAILRSAFVAVVLAEHRGLAELLPLLLDADLEGIEAAGIIRDCPG